MRRTIVQRGETSFLRLFIFFNLFLFFGIFFSPSPFSPLSLLPCSHLLSTQGISYIIFNSAYPKHTIDRAINALKMLTFRASYDLIPGWCCDVVVLWSSVVAVFVVWCCDVKVLYGWCVESCFFFLVLYCCCSCCVVFMGSALTASFLCA